MISTPPSEHRYTISVVVPIRNEPAEIIGQLNQLVDLDGILEVIVVDASDPPHKLRLQEILDSSITLVHSENAGRAKQMNLGSVQANGDILWFLHADSRVLDNSAALISESLEPDRSWGRFDVKFKSSAQKMQLIATMMNLRSAVTGICTGDQAIFVERELFNQVNGYPEIAIMEDIALSKTLKKHSQMARVRACVETSARRWESNGYLRTILLMWMMRLLYWSGVSPARLAKWYKQVD